MRIACLSGWGQPHDALESLVPSTASYITHIDYAKCTNIGDALLYIAEKAAGSDMLVGWSLGGQMALRAIATGLLAPARLVLIAAPFQFVKSPSLPIGMPKDLFEKFKQNYAKNPANTLQKAWQLIAKDDSNAENIRNQLLLHDKEEVLAKNWAMWLEILENYTCADLYTGAMPPTLLIHGDRDSVIFPEQSTHLANLLPQARIEIFNACGHAPHWHDPKRVQTLITAHAHV